MKVIAVMMLVLFGVWSYFVYIQGTLDFLVLRFLRVCEVRCFGQKKFAGEAIFG